ncbi:MAG: carboxypeptidase regulatory-like domain-containing protein [Deltaproteobacteria bacterium]|nr:carboxypeptidase regulatory-like domain-containing protein [Deltaproteobacteria bacterium]
MESRRPRQFFRCVGVCIEYARTLARDEMKDLFASVALVVMLLSSGQARGQQTAALQATLAASAAEVAPDPVAGGSPVSKPAERILILKLEGKAIPGKILDLLQAASRDAVQDVLGAKVRILPTPALDLSSMLLAAGCSDETTVCLAEIGRTLGATGVLRVVLKGSVERAQVSVVFVPMDNNPPTARTYDLVGLDEESAPEFRWHLCRALGGSPEPLYGEVKIVTPDGAGLADASIFVNEQLMRPDDLRRLPPGDYRIEVRRPGFDPGTWMGLVRGGRETTVPIAPKPRLRPSPAESAIAQSRSATEPSHSPRGPDGARVDRGTGPVRRAQGEPVRLTFPPVDPGAGGMTVTWILGAGSAVSTALWGIWYLRWQDAERAAGRQGYQCRTASGQPAPDAKFSVCRDGQALANQTLGLGVVAGSFVASTIVAFVLEGGFSSSSDARATEVGFVPAPGGALAAVSWRF